jgi:hypothetical protein
VLSAFRKIACENFEQVFLRDKKTYKNSFFSANFLKSTLNFAKNQLKEYIPDNPNRDIAAGTLVAAGPPAVCLLNPDDP